MIEHKLEHKNHMGAWFIDEIICDKILKFFYDNPNFHHKGESYFPDKKTNDTVIEYDKDVKESLEMEISSDVYEKPFDEYRDSLQKVLDNYIKRYNYLNGLSAFNINENYLVFSGIGNHQSFISMLKKNKVLNVRTMLYN